MVKRNLTNTDLAEKIDSIAENQKNFEETMRKEMQTFRDFMIIQIDRQKRKSDGGYDWGGIMKQMAIALVAALGVIATLVGILSK